MTSAAARIEPPDVAVPCACTLGESPVWSVREQSLYWVDVRGPTLHRYDAATRAVAAWSLPALAGAVVLRERGGVLVALASGIHAFAPADGACTLVVAPEPPGMGHRLNDTKPDRRGRLWTSTMRDLGATATGSLYRIDADLSPHAMLAGLRVPNAIAWSPDDATFYFADTRDGRLRAHAFDPEAGTLGAMRVLVDDGVLPGSPDGATVDADGCIWSARYGGGAVARITPAGRVDRIVRLPVPNVTACAFGDADLRTLYVTTARQRMSDDELAAMPHAGAVFAVRTTVPGLPEPACAW